MGLLDLGIFDSTRMVSVLGKDIKKGFNLLGLELSYDTNIIDSDIANLVALFSNIKIIIDNNIGPKSAREFNYILSKHKSEYIGLDPKAFSYKMYVHHTSIIFNFTKSQHDKLYKNDMRALTKIYKY